MLHDESAHMTFDEEMGFENRSNATIGSRIESYPDFLGLYGQVNKRIRWMPRQ